MAQIPVLNQSKENEIFLKSHFFSARRSSGRKRHFNAKLFLGLVFAAVLILASDYAWDYFNHTKLAPVVSLDVGKIQGVVMTKSGVEAEYYVGIPFAEPPINENRFEKTVPIKPWPEIKETTRQKLHCAPLDYQGSSASQFSEDCLYLNVARPRNRGNELLPVLFAIHGGAFEYGGADLYGVSESRGLSLLKNKVILVSIQYRLAVFGFASDGKKDFPGNYGYFDQAEALKFIHRNIKAFGGDPNQITIIGCSAGGASVTALSISSYTRDYVHQSIAMSGSAFDPWATNDVVVESTHSLIKILGQTSNESVKDRLKRATSKEIYDAVNVIGTTKFGENFGVFMPRIDGDFFAKDLPDLIREAPKKAIVIGLTSEESLAWTLIPSGNTSTSKLVIPASKIPNFSYKDLEGLVRDHIVLEKYFGNKTKEVQQKVLEFYSQSNANKKDNVFYLQRYTQILSDLQFNIGVLWEILLRGYHGWNVYAYNSPYFDKNWIPPRCPIKESFHGTDQHYADFVIDYDQFDESDDDIKMELQTLIWLISFIRTGKPAIPNFDWKPAQPSSSLQYAKLLPTPESNTGLFADRAKFWTDLTKEYDYNLVRMTPKKQDFEF
ncbi:Carboxylic ester hydrolase [Aphelenchoides bicaudatus]|nr:Carboxylic ester hydrolase [Aphelenchoides bicaudatus]